MRAISNTDLLFGQNEIPISIYSAIEQETGFKQLSKCCDSRVFYSKNCSKCNKVLTESEIYKALEVGKESYKAIDTQKLKVENGNLKLLGIVEDDSEQNGYFRNGNVWFLSAQKDKNKDKTERNIAKFSYLREGLKESKRFFLCIIAMRGKESLILLKPYENGFVGLGLYFAEQIRDIKEVATDSETDKATIKEMVKGLKEKPIVNIGDFANKRTELINLALSENPKKKEAIVLEQKKEINPKELLNF